MRSRVYRLNCQNCTSTYISEAGRAFQVRLEESLKAWWNNSLGISTFADHLITERHSFSDENATLLHIESDCLKRIVLEEFEILRHMKNDCTHVLDRFVPEEGFIFRLYSMSNFLYFSSLSLFLVS